MKHKADLEEIRRLVAEHVANTGSKKGQMILESFDEYVSHFKKIIPVDYQEMLKLITKAEEEGMDPEAARIEAFNEFVGNKA